MLPVLYQNHNFILYSYPLLMGLGWGVGYQIFFSTLDDSYSRLKAQIFFWGLFIFSWLGAKLLFSFTAAPSTEVLGQINFWTGGGFVFYGGLIGGLVNVGLFKLVDREFSVNVFWSIVPALAIGHGIGRIGCFLAGCCFGEKTDFFWGIYSHEHFRHPTQLIEATGLFLISLYLLKSKLPRFLLICHYLVLYGFLRFCVEFLRGDSIRGQWGLLSPSQWISLCLLILGIFFIIKNKFNDLQYSN